MYTMVGVAVTLLMLGIILLRVKLSNYLGKTTYQTYRIQASRTPHEKALRAGPWGVAGRLLAATLGCAFTLGVVQDNSAGNGLGAVWIWIALGVALLVLGGMAPLLRSQSAVTVPEFFRQRYGRFCGTLAAVVLLISLLGIMALDFTAAGLTFTAMFQSDYVHCVGLVMLGVVISVSLRNDELVQGLGRVYSLLIVLVFVGMAIAVPFFLKCAGGWNGLQTNLDAESFELFNGYGAWEIGSLIILFATALAVGQRTSFCLNSARSHKAARQGAWFAAAASWLFAIVSAVLGLAVAAIIVQGKFTAGEMTAWNARGAVPFLSLEVMPFYISIVVLFGLLVAVVASLEFAICAAGEISYNDIYLPYRDSGDRKAEAGKTSLTEVVASLPTNSPDNKQEILKSQSSPSTLDASSCPACQSALTKGSKRVGSETDKGDEVPLKTRMMYVFALVAAFLANVHWETFFGVLVFCFTLCAVCLFVPYVLGMVWGKASKSGAIAAMFLGLGTMLYLEWFRRGWIAGWYFSYSVIPSLMASLLGFVVFSWLFPRQSS